MQYEIVFHKNPMYGIVIAHGEGEVDDFRNLIEELAADTELEVNTPILFDFTDLDIGGLSTIDVRTIARFITAQEESFRQGRWAILVGSPLCFGMVRMLCSFIYRKVDLEANVFMDAVFAVRWLKQKDAVHVAD